jgi:biopolymer transport protein ExbB
VLEILLWPLSGVRALINEGGWIVYALMVASLIMWATIIDRWWYFSRVLPHEAESALAAWRSRPEHKSWYARAVRQMMISKLNAGMTANMQILRVSVPMCPLLGLVGTVVGMLEVFDSMSLLGNADAKSMASGVSHAMIATLSGLAVSVTGLYPLYYFEARARRESELLADHFEY